MIIIYIYYIYPNRRSHRRDTDVTPTRPTSVIRRSARRFLTPLLSLYVGYVGHLCVPGVPKGGHKPRSDHRTGGKMLKIACKAGVFESVRAAARAAARMATVAAVVAAVMILAPAAATLACGHHAHRHYGFPGCILRPHHIW